MVTDRLNKLLALGIATGAVLLALAACERQEAPGGATGAPVAAAKSPAPTPPPPDRPMPNVIVVLVDTLRADRLSLYGHDAALAPTLDAIGRDGLVFERAMAPAPWTQPSVASLFAGVYTGVHRVANYGQAMAQTYGGQPKVAVFSERFTTLAERLQAAGYATAAFVANPFILAEFGFAQGFGHFDARHAANEAPGSVINEAALAWLKHRPADRPFFLYLHYMDVHGPYPLDAALVGPLLDAVEAMPDKHELPDDILGRLGYLGRFPPDTPDLARHEALRRYREYWVARYDAGIRQFERHLAALREALAAEGLWDSSLLVVLSDHGEQLAEKGEWNHGDSVWQTELHVPLMIRWPGQVPAGRRVAQPVSLIDVAPTILDLVNLPDAEDMQGRTLLPLLEGVAEDVPRYVLAEAVKKPPEQKALLVGRWKLIQYFDTGRQALFDLAADPLELHDLAGEHPDRVADLQALLDAQLAANVKRAEGHSVEEAVLTPEQVARLRSLGYLGD